MQETSLTLTERQEIARAYIAQRENDAQEHGQYKDSFLLGTYRSITEELITRCPEAAALIKQVFLRR